jgi:FkbM family methyltransferase
MVVAIAASIMRQLPVGVRKVRYWRDKVYCALGAGGWDEDDALDAKWPKELQSVRHRNGMKLALDLTDWCQRRTYFTGRYYQEDIEDLLSSLLRPGDNFVDIGANIGLVTLHGASLGAKVYSFEPNPDVYALLMEHLSLNGLDKSRAFNMGLGESDGTLTLNLYGRHTGKATLVARPEKPARTVSVPIRRGDDVLALNEAPTLFKIDVEGFEASVLKGLGSHLSRRDVAVVIEVSRSWLEAAGSSAEEVHDLLESYGLKPNCFELRESRFNRSLVVAPIDGPMPDEQYDCLFLRPGSVFANRVR